MTTTGGNEANKTEHVRKLLDYIEQNLPLLERLFQQLVHLDLPSDSWHNLQSRLPLEDDLFNVLSSLEGVPWEASVQVYEQDEAGKATRVTMHPWSSDEDAAAERQVVLAHPPTSIPGECLPGPASRFA